MQILNEYRIEDPVLHRIARIIDEADTVQEACVEPTAAGLDIICEGLRRISSNDSEALEKGAVVYDALYSRLAAQGV
ncbi:MAG TPA: chromate resistance protein ChrB domain-containing protein [Lacipirellulaceae bacterium]|jgi:hypothetical protein|nr:chromate resistance protein ChrB domain-containing protein [Lacipirellulaceae bacterium]